MSRYIPPPETRNHKKPTSDLLSTMQAAAYLGVCEQTIRRWRDEGLIVAIRVGKKLWKYEPAELDKMKQTASA